MSPKTSHINELLTRGIEQIIPSRDVLARALASGKKLTVYLGVDPTAPRLHLGHSISLLLLRRFQRLGHKVVLLIGDFTAQIGDPSGKTTQRSPLSKKEVLANYATYKEQAAKILDFHSSRNPVTLCFNSAWHEKLIFTDVLTIASMFTVQQLLARDMFQKRVEEEKPIGVNEFLYPLAQGYDSVALKADVEVGGSDQLFNMLVGRDLVKTYLHKEKFVVATRLLVNPKTGAKMSKSEGTFVSLLDAPGEMYGKLMAFPDGLVSDCFVLCTEVPLDEIEEVKKIHPKEAKGRLAREIVAMYYSTTAALKAEQEFQAVFGEHELPREIASVKIEKKKIAITDLLTKLGLASSKSEARRLAGQGGVHARLPGRDTWQTVKNWQEEIKTEDGMILCVGKRKCVRVTI